MESMEGILSHTEKSYTPEEEQKQEIFDAQSPIMENIHLKGFAEYVASLENLQKAFDPLEHEYSAESGPCACCIDGRTKLGFRAAGSGMLLPENELADFLKIHEIKSISAHAECGAAKLYCQREGLPIENADTVAQEWAKNIAEKYDLEYIYIPLERMSPSLEFHPERVCYCDATGRFSNYGRDDLPEGFGIDCMAKKEKRWKEEIEIALEIAFGHHGLGELFTSENPFVLTAIADDAKELEEIKNKLNEIKHEYGDRVVIDGFVMPK